MSNRSFTRTLIVVALSVVGLQILAVALLGVIGRFVSYRNPPMSPVNPGEIAMEDFTWHKGLFGTSLLARLTLRDKTSRSLDNVTTRCDVYAPDGRVLGSTYQVLEGRVFDHSVLRFDEANMGFLPSLYQASRVNCSVVAIDWTKEDPDRDKKGDLNAR